MTRLPHTVSVVLAVGILLSGAACQLRRPPTTLARTIEPLMIEPQGAGASAPGAISVRLLETQRRGHIGRFVLRLQPDGELVEDHVWRWSSAPDQYLDTALRLEIASNAGLRLVDTRNAQTLAVTLLSWHLETTGAPSLVGSVELDITGPDRIVHPQMIRASEAVEAELPGNLAPAAGRLLRRLAAEVVARIPRPGHT